MLLTIAGDPVDGTRFPPMMIPAGTINSIRTVKSYKLSRQK